MYYADHPPPHFHARYGADEAKVDVASGEPIAGSLPGRARRLVREWANEHRAELSWPRAELEANWERLRNHEAPQSIAPLP